MGLFNFLSKKKSTKLDSDSSLKTRFDIHGVELTDQDLNEMGLESKALPPLPNVAKSRNKISKRSEKDKQGMAVFLQRMNNKKVMDRTKYPRYFQFEFNIMNAEAYHRQLIKEGYFIPASLKDTLKSFKLADLRSLCSKHGIRKTGKKADIIDRLCTELDPNLAQAIIDAEKVFTLSSTGNDFLDKYSDYVKLFDHKKWDISLEEYIKQKKRAKSKYSFYDIVWGIFNQKRLKATPNQLAFISLNMGDCLKEKHRDPSLFYGEYLYLSINTSNQAQYRSFQTKRESIQAINNQSYLWNLHVIDEIDIKALPKIIKRCQAIKLKYTILTPEMFWDLINEYKASVVFDTNKWNRLIQENDKALL